MAGWGTAAKTARRLWPVAVAAYHRWEQLSPAEKERYRRLARENARRGGVYARQGAARSREAATRSAQTVRRALNRRSGK